MQVALDIGDESLKTAVAQEITHSSHELLQAGTPRHAAEVIISDNLERTRNLEQQSEHLLALVQPDELGLLAGSEGDFAILPLFPGEIATRLDALALRPGPRDVLRSKLLTTAVEAAHDVIELTDASAVMQYINPAYERVLGYRFDEAVGRTPADLVRSGEHPPEFFAEIDRCLANGEAWEGVLISTTRDGRTVHLETTLSPVNDDDGNITHHVAVKRDITERLEREKALNETNRALEQARDAALAASRAKSEFLANMSHELRTPLNAIIGYSEILIEDFEADTAVTTDLSRIRTSGAHLLDLINDVLDISKIEADKLELYFEPVALDEIVRSVSATIEPLAKARDNEYHVENHCEGRVIPCDRVRLRQVLLNLLGNACKFTEHGRVDFSITELTPGKLQFSVKDTGVGIAADEREKIFAPFVQADSSTTREYGGSGLGLAISSRLIDMMNGDISVDSTLGQGSEFVLTLNIDEPQAMRTAASTESTLRDLRVLVIDDDETIHDLVSRSFTKYDIGLLSARTGEEGLKLAQSAPDLIILDVKLPGMSGWDVLSELKINERTAEIPVIMMTVLSESKVGHSLGAVDYVVKPVVGERLARLVQRHLGSRKAKVLVVEDHPATREVITRTLESSGYDVAEAVNGAQGLEQVRAWAPELVVLDLMMPVMDGYEFLECLRAIPKYADLPVVVATARSLSPQEREELEAVVTRVIEKNAYTREELIAQIDQYVARFLSPTERP
ncbi:MAG: response regulator [Pseudomonadota bacterium]